jgi:hypothetical protein
MTIVLPRFHDGELLVQQRAGVGAEAAWLVSMLAPPAPNRRWTAFFAQREFAVLTARDADQRLWSVPLLGTRGFLRAQDTTLSVHALPHPAGPLASMAPAQNVGLIAVEFSAARRMRLNGGLTGVDPTGLEIEAAEVYGNCPAHIRDRTLRPVAGASPERAEAGIGLEFTAAQRALIEGSDTFFLGTIHPERGADASHKGGQPGFVRVEPTELWWPDFAGNNMFNSLGNLTINDEAALLFLDFVGGRALHVSGHAGLEWVSPGSPGDDDGTGRRIRFRVDRVVEHALPLRASDAGDGQTDG